MYKMPPFRHGAPEVPPIEDLEWSRGPVIRYLATCQLTYQLTVGRYLVAQVGRYLPSYFKSGASTGSRCGCRWLAFLESRFTFTFLPSPFPMPTKPPGNNDPALFHPSLIPLRFPVYLPTHTHHSLSFSTTPSLGGGLSLSSVSIVFRSTQSGV